MSKTYFITGGGTGGHIYPALAVADELYNDGHQIFYIGNPKNLEASIVANKPYVFLPVISSGMPRKISFELILWVFKMFSAWLKCCYYIATKKPDVIFGTGGYVSAPVLIAGITMRKPFIMHDCDANPGLVTRKLAPYAKSVSIAFEEAKTKLNNKKCYLNGNPIRVDFSTITKEQARKNLGLENKLTLCIMGGSQGAQKINNAALGFIETLSKNYNVQIVFQTGKHNFDYTISELEKVYPQYKADNNIIIKPYFDDMVNVLKACDIAVSRAGSLSISELCASSIASIYIPYPYAAADHQRKNARSMVEMGAGLYLEDADTTTESLLSLILDLLEDENKLQQIQQASASVAKFDGVQKIVEQIKSI